MKLLKLFVTLTFILIFWGCATTSQYNKRASWCDEFSGKGIPNSQIWARSVTNSGTAGQL